MKNKIVTYSIAIPALVLFLTMVMMQTSIVYGQTTTGQNTFTAKGSIDSLVVKEGQPPIQFDNQTSYILDGNWKLEVINGNVTDFGTWLTMVHFDGTNRHSMAFMNFKQDNSTTSAIQGTA